MTVRIPYVEGGLWRETQEWGERHGASFQALHGDTGYHEALCEWWAAPGDLIIVEQDILPPGGVLDSFGACGEGWCTASYPIPLGLMYGNGLGCVRFSEALRREYPRLAEQAGEPSRGEVQLEPARHWAVLDTRLAYRLLHGRVFPHDHGIARHLSVRTSR